MSCNENTDKYPYVYECCPESIDGITSQFLIDLFQKDPGIVDHHIICCACGKIYHIFVNGMKWTEKIATHSEIVEYKKGRDKYFLKQSEGLRSESEEKEFFSISDIEKFRCKICNKGMFEIEPYSIKEKFISDLNSTVGSFMKITSEIITKEQYINEWNKFTHIVNSCRRCTELSLKRMNIGKYN